MQRTVFVSYSRKDSARVQQAVELLEAGGAEVFRDVDDIKFGDRWEEVIRAKLAECERVMVFWSNHAQASEWVGREWDIALSMNKRLVPVLLDDTPLPKALGQFHALSNFLPQPGGFKWRYLGLGAGGLVGVALLAVVLLPTLNHAPAPMLEPEPVPPPAAITQSNPFSQPEQEAEPYQYPKPGYLPEGPVAAPDSREVRPRNPPKATGPAESAPLSEPMQLPVFLPWLSAVVAILLVLYIVGRRRSQRLAQQKANASEALVKMVFEES